MHPVIVIFIGTCADMRPIRIIFSPVSGWKAESKMYLAFHSSSSVSPGETMPFLQDQMDDTYTPKLKRHLKIVMNLHSVTGATCSQLWFCARVLVVRWSEGCSWDLWRWRSAWLDLWMCSGPTGAPWCLWKLIALLPYLSGGKECLNNHIRSFLSRRRDKLQ